MSAASIYASPKALQSDHQPTESNRKVSSASSSASPFSEALLRAPPHPALKTPVLHVTGLEQSGEADISDQDVMSAVAHCLRARPKLKRGAEGIQGIIEFEHLLNAEKAYATVQEIPLHNLRLSLSINDPTSPAPADASALQPQAKPRLIKHLPTDWTAARIFELFRPFGPVHRVAIQLDPSRAHFTGLAVVDFYNEAQAATAAAELHFSDQQGQTISVQPYESTKGPLRGLTTTMAQWVHAPEFHPASEQLQQQQQTHNHPGYMPQQQQQQPYAFDGAYGPPAYMSPPPTSPSLTSAWAVPPAHEYSPPPHSNLSYTNPGSSAPADPCNLFLKNLDTNISSQDLFQTFKRFGHIVSARVMRDEVTGQSKEFGFVSFTRPQDAAAAKDAMDGRPLQGVHGASPAIVVRFHEPKKLREQKMRDRFASPRARQADFDQEAVLKADVAHRFSGVAPPGSPPMPSSPQAPAKALVAAPESLASSSRSASPAAMASGQPLVPQSERDRLLQAVSRLGLTNAEPIVGLLLTLSKKERALCLFNGDVLRSKVSDAQGVLEASDADEVDISAKLQNVQLENGQLPTPQSTPERRSAKSSREAAAASATVPAQSSTPEVMTTATLAKMPALRLVELASSDTPSPLMASPPAEVVQEIDAFMDGLKSRPVNEQKQKLGERLFKKIKELGFKSAPKLTIHLLDTEDLRALAHLMAEQPEILKEKVALIQLK